MGRPLNHRYFGDLNVNATTQAGQTGGEGVTSVTLASNNSTGYTNGAAVTFSAPQIAGGQTATGTVVTGPAGALTTKTTFTATGTKAAANVTALTVTPTTTTGTGSGATLSITTTGGGAAYSVGSNLTVTVVNKGTGYALTDTVTIKGSVLGGVDTTNDLVLTIATFVAAAGTITSITITAPGTGYTSAPTVTLPSGTVGTLTTTAVLTTNAIPDAISVQAITVGSTNRTSGNDIVRQVGSKRFRVTTQDGTAVCTLVTATPTTAGQMAIVATDSASGTYWVKKITNRTAVLVQNSGSQFASGTKVKWTLGSAVLNTSVSITSA